MSVWQKPHDNPIAKKIIEEAESVLGYSSKIL